MSMASYSLFIFQNDLLISNLILEIFPQSGLEMFEVSNEVLFNVNKGLFVENTIMVIIFTYIAFSSLLMFRVMLTLDVNV